MNATSKKNDLKSLRSEIVIIRKNILNFNFQKSTGQLEKTSKIKLLRRKIASLKTTINQQKGKQDV